MVLRVRVLPVAPRLAADCFCRQRLGGCGSKRLLDGLALAADCFCRQRLGGYSSKRLLDGLAPPRRPTLAAATGI